MEWNGTCRWVRWCRLDVMPGEGEIGLLYKADIFVFNLCFVRLMSVYKTLLLTIAECKLWGINGSERTVCVVLQMSFH